MLTNLYDDLMELMGDHGLAMDMVNKIIARPDDPESAVELDTDDFIALAGRTVYDPYYGFTEIIGLELYGDGFRIELHEYDGRQEWTYSDIDPPKGQVNDLHTEICREDYAIYDTEGPQWHRRPYTLGEVREAIESLAPSFGLPYVDLVHDDRTEPDAALEEFTITYERHDGKLGPDGFMIEMIKLFGVNIDYTSPDCLLAKMEGFHGTRLYERGDGKGSSD